MQWKLLINIKKGGRTYEIVTDRRSSNSGDPGEGCSAIFAFLCLVRVSRISLQKKIQKISTEDCTQTNMNMSLLLVTGAQRLSPTLMGYALRQILLSTWSKPVERRNNSLSRCNLWKDFLGECLGRRLFYGHFWARFGPKYNGFKFRANKMKVMTKYSLGGSDGWHCW